MGIDRGQARRPTQPARAEGRAHGIEARYRALLDAIPDLIFRVDREGRFLDFSPAKGQEPALPPAEFLGRTVREVMPTELAAEIMRYLEQALQTGDTQVFEYQLPVPLPSGNVRDYEARIVKCGDNEVLGIVRDMTGHRQVREAVRASQARYRQVFDHVHDVFYRADMNGAFSEISPSVKWWGYDPEQLVGTQVADVYADPQERAAFLSVLLDQGRVIDYEVRLKTADGRAIDASVSSYLLRDPDGVVVGIEGIARDITQRKNVEKALLEAEERLRTLVKNAPVILFAVDREGMFTVAEGTAIGLTGLRADEFIGRSVFDMYRDVPGVIDAARRALGGEAFATVAETEGTVFEAHVGPVRDADGAIVGAVAVATDITGRHKAEEMLRTQRDLAVALSTTTALQDTLCLCVRAAIRVSGLDSGCVHLGDRSAGAYYLACHEGLSDEFVERIARFDADSAYVRAAMTGKPIYTRYEKLAMRMDEPRRREGLRAMAAVPVQHEGEVIACLCVASHSVDDIPHASRAALEAIALRIGGAVVRSRADEALRESEERFRRLAEDSIDGVLLVESSEVRFANAALVQMFGYESDDEIVGRPFTDFLSPDYRELMAQRGQARNEGQDVPDRYEFKALRKDGSELDAEISVSTIVYRAKQARLGVIKDITERKQAERALRDSEERFRSLSEATLEGIVIHDGGRILDANPQAAAMLGYELSEVIGMGAWRFLAPDCHDLVRQRMLSGCGEPYEVSGLRKDGTTFPMEVCGKTASYEGRQVRVGVMRDITERKRAEEALRESENRFRTLSEAGFEGIAIHNKGTIVDGNQAFAGMFGYELPEAIGMYVLDFVADESCDLVLQHIASKYAEPFEFTGLRKDGLAFPVEVRGRAIPYQGKMVTVAGLRDLTERKRMEEALQKAREELESRAEHAMRRGNPYSLSFRELTVLYLIAAGRSDKEIAYQLGISPRTASKHVENILQKMGVASRTKASVQAVRGGLLADAQ
jgi:PAS domain S-box-containing protein